jgi:hypothetical protein
MDQVVVTLGFGRLSAQHASGNGAKLTREVTLEQPLEWACRDMNHLNTGCDVKRGDQMRSSCASEDINLHTALRETFGGLYHVDIHATGIAGTGLVKW